LQWFSIISPDSSSESCGIAYGQHTHRTVPGHIVTRATNDISDKPTIIEVRNLSAGYGDEIIIRNVSFDVKAGEVFAILGRSGCGKTTLFKAMIGLLEPTEGHVTIDGDKVVPVAEGGSERFLRKIGVLFQSGALFTSLTLAENVAVPLQQYTSLPETTIKQLVVMKLAEVGLNGYERHLPSELSGGMQKRGALARAMAVDPKILFFDEPSAGLDPITSAELDQTILKINATLGTTVILVTHELASIMAVADRVIMLDPDEKGIIAEGDPERLRVQSSDPRVRSFFNRSGGTAGG
jgi:phospholipid/cholesterol/gamma-HCH transport system ATP-binding protein